MIHSELIQAVKEHRRKLRLAKEKKDKQHKLMKERGELMGDMVNGEDDTARISRRIQALMAERIIYGQESAQNNNHNVRREEANIMKVHDPPEELMVINEQDHLVPPTHVELGESEADLAVSRLDVPSALGQRSSTQFGSISRLPSPIMPRSGDLGLLDTSSAAMPQQTNATIIGPGLSLLRSSTTIGASNRRAGIPEKVSFAEPPRTAPEAGRSRTLKRTGNLNKSATRKTPTSRNVRLKPIVKRTWLYISLFSTKLQTETISGNL